MRFIELRDFFLPLDDFINIAIAIDFDNYKRRNDADLFGKERGKKAIITLSYYNSLSLGLDLILK